MSDKSKMTDLIEQKKLAGSRKKPKYGTRKLTIGLVSCMLGFTLLVSPTDVWADEDGTSLTSESLGITESDLGGVADSDISETAGAEEKEELAVTPLADLANEEANPIEGETPQVEEALFTQEQRQQLKEAGYTDAEIDSLEETAKAEKEAEENFDVNKYIEEAIKLKEEAELL